MAPRIGMVANIQANVVIDILMKIADASNKRHNETDYGIFVEMIKKMRQAIVNKMFVGRLRICFIS